MRTRLAAPLVGAIALLPGCCCVGTVSRFDGEWPLESTTTEHRWEEVVSGEGGSLLRPEGSGSRLVAVTPRGTHTIELDRSLDLAGSAIVEGVLYRVTPAGVVKSSLDDPSGGETLARIEGARAVSFAEGALLVVRPGGVVLVRGASARTIWQGEALAVTADARRKAAWIVAKEPLLVIDLVALEDDTVLLRVPLPEMLASPNVRVTLSGGSAVVWAHDRPLNDALIVSPELGCAWPLLGPASASVTHTPGTFEKDASPPFLVPGTSSYERGDQRLFGRVAPLSDGRFVAVSAGRDWQLSIASIGSATSAELPPGRQELRAPEGWKNVCSGVTWASGEVFVLADPEHALRVKKNLECDLDAAFDLGRSLRHGVNYFLNVPIVTTELAFSVAGGVPLGCLAVPFAPFLFCVEPRVGLLAFVAPVWFPFVRM